MKLFSHKIFSLAVLLPMLAFVSCQTEMELSESINSYQFEESYKTPNMEFIGFKTSDDRWDDNARTYWTQIKSSEEIQNFGTELQEGGIALDKTASYFGNYTPADLKDYKNKTRYVSFVEIPDFQLTYKTNNSTKTTWFLMGTFGVTAPICWPVSVAIPAKTNMTVKMTENIFVYDTESDEIVYRKAVSINEEQEFKGIFGVGSNGDGKQSGWGNTGLWPVSSGTEIVYTYWATVIANKALAEYETIKKNPKF